MRLCDFPDCSREHYGHGFCRPHYAQKKRGAPLTTIKLVRPRGVNTQRDEAGNKLCFRCKAWLPESTFTSNPKNNDGLHCYCRPCKSDHNRLYRFGVTPERLTEMLDAQGGLCPLCRVELGDSFCIDHDHACCPGTKMCARCVRAVLCEGCNRMLGMVERHPAILGRTVEYVQNRGVHNVR